MRGRERLFATLAIWTAFAVVMNNLMDNFVSMSADFSGLWPPFSYFDSPVANADYNQFSRLMNETATQIVTQVDQIITHQMSINMPILVILALALILAATISTVFVWRYAHLETDAAQARRAGQPATKSKRGGRVEQVMKALDEDEIAELRARLVADEEGETVSLEELLATRGGR